MTGKGKIQGGARKNAGRKKGGSNRATIERAALAERVLAEAAGKPGRKLGRELLEEFAVMFAGLAASFQPTGAVPGAPLSASDMETWAKSYREPLFEKYAKLAAKCANDFADFQSPRLGRLQTVAPAPESAGRSVTRMTLNIFNSTGEMQSTTSTEAPPPALSARH